jgi:hypothetical protein
VGDVERDGRLKAVAAEPGTAQAAEAPSLFGPNRLALGIDATWLQFSSTIYSLRPIALADFSAHDLSLPLMPTLNLHERGMSAVEAD